MDGVDIQWKRSRMFIWRNWYLAANGLVDEHNKMAWKHFPYMFPGFWGRKQIQEVQSLEIDKVTIGNPWASRKRYTGEYDARNKIEILSSWCTFASHQNKRRAPIIVIQGVPYSRNENWKILLVEYNRESVAPIASEDSIGPELKFFSLNPASI